MPRTGPKPMPRRKDRLTPPRGMSAEGKRIFREIVASVPASYFSPADSYSLEVLVAAILRHREAVKNATDDPDDPWWKRQKEAAAVIASARRSLALATSAHNSRHSVRMKSEHGGLEPGDGLVDDFPAPGSWRDSEWVRNRWKKEIPQ
jgi:hypothetical protein